MRPAIELFDVSAGYGPVAVLRDVSARVEAQEICGLIGVNGSGKSTLFKIVLGLVKPRAGSVELFGEDPTRVRRRGEIGYVPQAEDVDWDFPVTVRDVVMMGRYASMGTRRRATAADSTAVTDALDRVGLSDLATRQIGALSGGQRKRAFIARAIAQRARLLLLDEPFAGVDVRSEADMIAILKVLRSEGTSVFIATHDLIGLPQLADSAILLHGTVIAAGAPDQVLQPDNFAKAFGGGRGV